MVGVGYHFKDVLHVTNRDAVSSGELRGKRSTSRTTAPDDLARSGRRGAKFTPDSIVDTSVSKAKAAWIDCLTPHDDLRVKEPPMA